MSSSILMSMQCPSFCSPLLLGNRHYKISSRIPRRNNRPPLFITRASSSSSSSSSNSNSNWDKLSTSFQQFRSGFNRLSSEFVNWNKWDNWKDINTWEPKRLAALVVYIFAILLSFQKLYAAFQAPRIAQHLTDAYMEALIPLPTPDNVTKVKKGMWRRTMPKGLKIKKFIQAPNGTIIHDTSYVGEHAWNQNIKPVQRDIAVSAYDQDLQGSWRQRLHAWAQILEKDKLREQMSSFNAKYAIEFDMKEVENSLRKDVEEKARDALGARALWISKRWWRYRPKLPYTYFLQKLDTSEVAAIVFTEDLKRLYVTMKEGFPLEYVLNGFFSDPISSFQPVGENIQTKSMYREVILGCDVWDLPEEM